MTTNGLPAVSDPTPFLADFREESGELLRVLDSQLLVVEGAPQNLDALREMFLSVHTIKGGASMLRLAEVSELAHALEDVLARLQKDENPVDRHTIELLFQSLDMLRDLSEQDMPGAGETGLRAISLAAELRERAVAESLESPPPNAASPADTIQRQPTSLPTVLLVEDSPTVRMLVTMLLSKAGITVEALSDGREALDRASSRPYNLVITSMETRGMRGLELAAALRDSGTCQDVPIILMSSDDDPEHRRQAFRAGVQAYIRKGSFDRWRLLETVRELLPSSTMAAAAPSA